MANCRDFGHNGLTVGQAWNNRTQAKQAGAHGQLQRGICGDLIGGAYSIVLSHKYASLDVDDGDTIEYAGEKSDVWRDQYEPPDTHGNRILQTSIRIGRSVRVLRHHSCGMHGPPRGVRYDGLYRVVGVAQHVNEHVGVYERFILQREYPEELEMAPGSGAELAGYNTTGNLPGESS